MDTSVANNGLLSFPIVVADSAGNTYSTDGDLNSNGQRLLVFSAHNVQALGGGTTITITLETASASVLFMAASAAEFSGLATVSPLDRSSGSSGYGSSITSGATAPTTHADELLLGVAFVTGFAGNASPPPPPPPAPASFTPGAGYTAMPSADGTYTTGSFSYRYDLESEFRIVSASGSYQADGTLGDSRLYVAALFTYRAAGTASPPGIPVPAAPVTASGLLDISSLVRVSRGKVVQLAGGGFSQKVTIRNVVGGSFHGPLALVLEHLPRKVKLRSRTGFTTQVAPPGSPFVDILPNSLDLFRPGDSVTVTLTFSGAVQRRLHFDTRVLAGAGVR